MEAGVPGGTRDRDETEAKTRMITQANMQKIKSHDHGKGEGEDLQLETIPKLGDKWERMYTWILVLMEYIYGMVCWEFRDLRIVRVIHVLRVTAGIRRRKGTEHLV